MVGVGDRSDVSGNTIHIKDLIPDPENLRAHNPRNIGVIVDALHEVGAARSIVIDENNQILAGNGTIEAAGQAGIERLRVIEADGNEIIAVRRRNLTPEGKKRLSIYDNRAAELAEWNVDALAQIAKDRPEVLEKMFYSGELDALIAAARSVDGNTQVEESTAKGLRQLNVSLTQEQFEFVDKILETLVENGIQGPSPHAEGNALYVVFEHFSRTS